MNYSTLKLRCIINVLLHRVKIITFLLGFVEGLRCSYQGDPFDYSLLLVKVSSAIGAAYLGAKAAGYRLPVEYADNVDQLYHHTVDK